MWHVKSCVLCEKLKGGVSHLHKVEADDRRAEPLQTGHEMEGSWRCKWSGTINWMRKKLET